MTQMIGTPAPGSMISSTGMQSAQPVGNQPGMQQLMAALLKQKAAQKQAALLNANAPPPTMLSQYSGTAGVKPPGDGQGGSGGLVTSG